VEMGERNVESVQYEFQLILCLGSNGCCWSRMSLKPPVWIMLRCAIVCVRVNYLGT